MRYDPWAHVLELEPSDLRGRPDHVVDQWHVVRRSDGIQILGWQSPGQWEPCMSGRLVAFDVMVDAVIDSEGLIYRLERDAKGDMHPKIADFLERTSGAMPG